MQTMGTCGDCFLQEKGGRKSLVRKIHEVSHTKGGKSQITVTIEWYLNNGYLNLDSGGLYVRVVQVVDLTYLHRSLKPITYMT